MAGQTRTSLEISAEQDGINDRQCQMPLPRLASTGYPYPCISLQRQTNITRLPRIASLAREPGGLFFGLRLAYTLPGETYNDTNQSLE
jgi:hypothetical protein